MANSNYKVSEVAKHAGVSPATVSRFFNHSHVVSKKTREKITDVLARRGHGVPVEKMVGLVIPDANNPYFTGIAFQFEQELERRGWHLLISSSDDDSQREAMLIDRFKGLGIRGLIYINTGDRSIPIQDALLKGNQILPILVFDRRMPEHKLDYVAINSREGSLCAVDYLRTFGHERIGYLKGKRGTQSAVERFESFESAMAKNRLLVTPDLVFQGDYQLASGRACAEQLLQSPPDKRPSAIICANDLMAIGLMQRLQKEGWKLPEQLSIIGFDDIMMSEWIYPSLTTVSQPLKLLANKAVEILLKRIAAREQEEFLDQQVEEISPTLVPRESVTTPFYPRPALQVLKA